MFDFAASKATHMFTVVVFLAVRLWHPVLTCCNSLDLVYDFASSNAIHILSEIRSVRLWHPVHTCSFPLVFSASERCAVQLTCCRQLWNSEMHTARRSWSR